MMKLSVVTISFNEKETIRETIQSVLRQSFDDKEYIIIDGASKDGTAEIIKEYQDNISLVISEPDDGIFYAMNKALDFCKGEYILFLNAGDKLVSDDVLSSVFNGNPTEELIYGDVIFKYNNGVKMRRKSPLKLSKKYFYIDSLNHQTTFTKRELFSRTGNFDTNLKITSDYDFILNAIFKQGASYKYLPIPIAEFNLMGLSSDKTHFHLHKEERKICIQKYFSEEEIVRFQKAHLYYDIVYKKIRYAYFLVMSNLSKKYLYG